MDAPHPPLEGADRLFMTLALAAASFMVVLDTSIANVSIPGISGELGVSPSQGTWVITSFAVSNAIAVPLTGWLARRIGEVRLFVLSMLLFSLASLGCGLSTSMPMLIAFRVLQGAVAGPMMPLSQTLLLGIYPMDRRAMALAIWSLTTLVAPVAGPILGGWITDNMRWPWIFYINVPIGVLCMWLVWVRMRLRESRIVRVPIDRIGLALLVIGIGSLQVMLDKAGELDWFNSKTIVALAVIAALAISLLVAWELTEEHPIIDLHLFQERNFTSAAIAVSAAYVVFFGTVVLLPLWLQTEMGYTPTWAGLVMAPTGILAIVVTPFIGKNMHRLDPRLLATVGFVIFAFCAFLRAKFEPGADFYTLAMPQLIQGVAVAMFFVPLTTIALSSLPAHQIASASGLFNFLRILAGGAGTSVATTVWERREALHHAQITENVTAYSPAATNYLSQLHGLGADPGQSLSIIDRLISTQAYSMATADMSYIAAWIFIGLIPLLWLARPPFGIKGAPIAAD
ncbi:MAG TPA: DHA2 family efflux MFS transporter permease subunit [Usitatibacter sp.]|jgi:DHA2 family multidrug resistance protein|nr:DHA2 family efflux MFS transporter permease subunit [Usitatibacter sp.]